MRCFHTSRHAKPLPRTPRYEAGTVAPPHRRTFVPVTGWGQRRPPPPTYRLKTDVCYVQTHGYKYTPNPRRRSDTTGCGSRAAPARPRPTPARSLPPALGPSGGTVPSRMLRALHVCPGDVSSPVARGSGAWGAAASAGAVLRVFSQPGEAVNKSTSRGHCCLGLRAGLSSCWAPGEAKGVPGAGERALQPGGLFLAVAAVPTTVLKAEGQREGGEGERSTASTG